MHRAAAHCGDLAKSDIDEIEAYVPPEEMRLTSLGIYEEPERETTAGVPFPGVGRPTTTWRGATCLPTTTARRHHGATFV